MNKDLLKESLSTCAEEYDIILPEELLEDMVDAIGACREMESYSYGGYNPVKEENDKLKKQLEDSTKVSYKSCPVCSGSGFYYVREWDTFGEQVLKEMQVRCARCNGSGEITVVGI